MKLSSAVRLDAGSRSSHCRRLGSRCPSRPANQATILPVCRASSLPNYVVDATITRRGLLATGIISGSLLPGVAGAEQVAGPAAYDFDVQQYEEITSLTKFAGQVTVVLNIASA
eukprot:jgi/Botrbrau1/17336/Bobra.0015s0082.1